MTTIDEVRQFVGKEATLAELAELDTLIGHARRELRNALDRMLRRM